jgi:hypothetical protein
MTMFRHLLGIAAVSSVILYLTFLPFTPGRYDPAASTMSFLAQLSGIIGLLLVPLGIGWLIHEMRRHATAPDRRRIFLWMTIVAVAIVVGIVVLAALASSLAIGTGLFLLYAGALTGGIRRTRALSRQTPAPRNVDLTALHLIAVPIVVLAVQSTFVAGAVRASRNIAIDNASELIDAVETYHDTNGQYPQSLLAVWPDYLPGTSGVSHYDYQRTGTGYTISFEQFRFHPIGTREIVVYSPQDQHAFISHASWRLTHPELQGWYAAHDTDRARWRYFWFD